MFSFFGVISIDIGISISLWILGDDLSFWE